MLQGLVIVLSAPSGAGKSTLCQAITTQSKEIRLSVSCTTRTPRPLEKEGRDYFFLSEKEFLARRDRGEFLEWAKVHDHYYSTPRAPIEADLALGLDVLMDIDTQGAMAVKKSFPDSVLVFLFPPSWEELEKRLRHRKQDAESVIQRRLANARAELDQAPRYDYWVVNDQRERAIEDLQAILRAEHRRPSRLPSCLIV